jgi:hypothetical protein
MRVSGTDPGLAAPCGLYCGDCEHYRARCSGCGTIAGKPFWTFEVHRLEVCPLYGCCVTEKGLEHCGQCETFSRFYDPSLSPEEGARNVLARKRSLLRRREVGTERWLEERRK